MAKEGSSSVPIYATTIRIYRLDPVTGQKTLKSEHPQFTIITMRVGYAHKAGESNAFA